MQETHTQNNMESLTSFTDVVYLSSEGRIHPEIRVLLKDKKLSWGVFDTEKFEAVQERLDLVGTVVIDATNLSSVEQPELARMIELFDRENIGVILLTNQGKMRKGDGSPGSGTSGWMVSSMGSTSMDELWIRISVNLSHRRKSAGMMSGPAVASQEQRQYKNQLAEQLQMTGALVDNLVEQLRMAGLVQRDFLPSQLPDSDNIEWGAVFMPAEWVSGDIYDAVRVDEQHIGFYIADAVGHAMPAALLTMFVKQALVMRETVENDYRIFSPAEVMSNLNRRMTGQKLSGYQFATCCYCLLNTKTLQLTYARAGHPYPVLIRPGEEPRQLEGRGSLLGVFDQAEFGQETTQLKSGDKLLLYSDGAEPFIGEFDDQTGFRFHGWFLELMQLPVGAMMKQFTESVADRSVSAGEVDDVTMLCLEIR